MNIRILLLGPLEQTLTWLLSFTHLGFYWVSKMNEYEGLLIGPLEQTLTLLSFIHLGFYWVSRMSEY